MNSFYEALPYALIFVKALGPAMMARRSVISGTAKSKWTVAFLAALPIPALLAAFAIFAFMDILVSNPTRCSIDGCASDREAFITLIVAALILYLFGLFNALMGHRMGRGWLKRRQSQ